MRERITFVQKPDAALDPSLIEVEHHSIRGSDIEAAREDRLTFALDELPTELQTLLRQSHELHIRWASPIGYEAVSPLLSRLTPGLHLFYTPATETPKDSPSLCSILRKSFGEIDCSSPAESFTLLPKDRFSHSTTYQFFQPLNNLSHLARYLKEEICSTTGNRQPCATTAERLVEATSVDLSYDAISHTVKVTALWPYQRQPLHITSGSQRRTEVGILVSDKPPNLEPHELGVSGLLTVLGQDEKPSPTIFSFPSRHRDAESTFSAQFMHPTGLHPTLQLRLDFNQPPAQDSSCLPHAYLTLPRSIFPDQYQLTDALFLASKNLTALRYSSQPVDLEAPEYVMKSWGSVLLVELSPPSSDKSQEWTVEIPLHLRYLSPLAGGYRSIEVPYPTVFWACAAEEGTKFPNNPFERVNLGYDGLFGPRTVFWHLHPQPPGGGRIVNTIKVPVLDLEKAQLVNLGTAAAVLLGFLWVVWKLLMVSLKPKKSAVPSASSSGLDGKKTQ